MGFIKKSLFILTCVAIFIGILGMNAFLTFGWSLNYDNVKPEIYSVLEKITLEEGKILTQSQIDKSINDIYYKNYSCNMWECRGVEETPFFLVSKMAHDYWIGKFYWILIVLILLSVLSFFLVENKTGLSVIIGAILIVATLPLKVIKSFVSSLQEFQGFTEIVTIFFSKANSVFWIMIILGIILVILGIVLKIIKFEEKLFGKSSSINNSRVKEEKIVKNRKK